MAENVVISFISDTSDLQKTVSALESVEAADANLGAEFKKNNAAFSDRQKALDQQSKAGTSARITLDQLSESVKKLNQNVIGNASTKAVTEFGNQLAAAATKSVTLTTQLRALKQELSAMEVAGKSGSRAFTELAIRAAKMEDQIGDTAQRIRVLASDTKNLDAALSLATGLAGAFAIAQGASALFGKENEELQKALIKVQAALAILNGLQAVAATLNKTSAASVVIFGNAQTGAAAKTGIYGFALRAVMVIQKAFAVSAAAAWAIATAGVALLVTGIVLLIQKLGQETKVTNDLVFAQQKLNHERAKAAERLKEQTKEAFDAIAGYGKKNEDVSRTEIELAKIRGAKAKELFNLEVALLNDKLSFLELTGKKETDEYAGVLNQKKILTARYYQDLKDQREKDFINLVNGLADQADQEARASEAEIERIANEGAEQVKQNSEINRLITEAADFAIETKQDVIDVLAEFDASGFETFKEFEEKKRAESAKTKEQRIEDDIAYLQAYAGVVKALFNFGLQLNQNEIAALEDKHDKGLISEKKYRRELAILQRKQAIAEKAQAAFSVAISTIVQVAANIAVPIIAALIAAAGAVQLALVLSKPIPELPKFAKGTKKAPAGAKWVGEKGPELVVDPGGYAILPHEQSMKFAEAFNSIESPSIVPDLPYISNASMNAMEKYSSHGTQINYDLLADKLSKKLGDEIAKHPRLNVTLDEHGFTKSIIEGINKQRSLDKYYSFNG